MWINDVDTSDIDTTTSYISGIVAKEITDIQMATSSGSKIVNGNISLTISFTLVDAITKDDYFEVVFPGGTIITLSTVVAAPFTLNNNGTYTPGSNMVRFYRASNAPLLLNGTAGNITFLTFTAPNSTKPSSPIIVSVLRNGSAKMRGSGTFTADPNTYSLDVTTTNSMVNALTSYSITFTLLDPLDLSGYILLTIPS
jgi:hypothetical protein